MNILKYISYFFFIAINWNLRLAWFTIRQEIKGEKKYGINTIGTANLEVADKDIELLNNAEHYQGANYYLLEEIFSFLKEEGEFIKVVDFGSGKGRILAVSAFHGFKKITGVELSEKFIKDAAENLKSIKKIFPDVVFELRNEDASKYIIEDDCSVFFFFNPFNEIVILPVVKNILNSIKRKEREVFVAYINPVHKEIFLSAGFTEVFHLKKYEYIECTILMYPIYE